MAHAMPMKRILFAGLLGGIAAWTWGAIVWVALGLHLPSINSFSDPAPIKAALSAADGQGTSGMYWVPSLKHSADMAEEDQVAAQEAWMDEATEGPYAIVYLHPEGVNAHSMHYLWKGLLLEILAATLAAWILALACACGPLPYMKRVAVVATLGFSAVGTVFSAMAVNTRAREIMLPVLFFPIVVPVIIAAVEATRAILAGEPYGDFRRWVELTAAFDAVFVVAAAATFEFVLGD